MSFMGSFDTVHTGSRCGQTKALGKGLRDLSVGDRVRTYPSALNEDDWTLELAGKIPAGPDSFQTQMSGGGYLTVRNTIITGWDTIRDTDLPLFDYLGHPVDPDDEDTHVNGYTGGAALSDYRAQLERQAADGTESDSEAELSRLFSLPLLVDLEPGSDEHTAHLARLRTSAQDELDRFDGLPVRCPVCADLRTR